MEGLFDGGFDMSKLTDWLHPIGTANAAAQPTSGLGGMTPQQLINSEAGRNPINSPLPPVEPPVDATRSIVVPPSEAPVTPPAPTLTPPVPVTPAGAPALGRGTSETGLPPDNLGAALTGNAGTSGSTEISARAKRPEDAKESSKNPTLAEALKGAKAPPDPTLQKISTPAAPRPTTAIKGGDLLALLTALNAGGAAKPLGR